MMKIELMDGVDLVSKIRLDIYLTIEEISDLSDYVEEKGITDVSLFVKQLIIDEMHM